MGLVWKASKLVRLFEEARESEVVLSDFRAKILAGIFKAAAAMGEEKNKSNTEREEMKQRKNRELWNSQKQTMRRVCSCCVMLCCVWEERERES